MKITDACEYNPKEGRPAYSNEGHAPAEVIVGQDGLWRLCKECAALPYFKRFRVRKPIKKEA